MSDIKIPKIGLTFSRKMMPQLGPTDEFLSNLKKHNVGHKHVTVDPAELKSSQSEFDLNAVRSIMKEPKKTKSSIIVSNDGYVLDGHHRWIADHNLGKKTKAIQVDLPILELMRLSKTFDNTQYKDVKNVMPVVKRVVMESQKNRIYK